MSFLQQERARLEAMGYPLSVAQEGGEALSVFLSRVYSWLLGGIIVAGAVAWWFAATGAALVLMKMGALLFFIVALGVLFGTLFFAQAVRHSSPLNMVAYALMAAAFGFVASPLIMYALAIGQSTLVLQALAITSAAFVGLTVWAYTSKTDFSFLRGILWAGFWVVLAVGVLFIFFTPGRIAEMIWSAAGALVFAGFTLYDTQKIIRVYPRDEHVAAAIQLLVDFVNLFLFILRLLLASDRR